MKKHHIGAATAAAIALAVTLVFPRAAEAHCDGLDGPVIVTARAALEQKDITPLLKWVKPEAENELRDAFARTLAVRQQGPDAKELADTWFFETLVRVHRAGEGAPYTGLKRAGAIPEPIRMADAALDSGSVDVLAKTIGAHAAEGVRERFARAAAAKAHSAESVAAGRQYVEAYVGYVHYVEALVGVVHGGSAHHEE